LEQLKDAREDMANILFEVKDFKNKLLKPRRDTLAKRKIEEKRIKMFRFKRPREHHSWFLLDIPASKNGYLFLGFSKILENMLEPKNSNEKAIRLFINKDTPIKWP
jgi:hypothetical protein